MSNPETPAARSFSRHSIRDAKSGAWTRYYTAGTLDDAIKSTLRSKAEGLRPIPGAGKTVVIDPVNGIDPEVITSLGGEVVSWSSELDTGPYDPLAGGK